MSVPREGGCDKNELGPAASLERLELLAGRAE
jgi:hypothetical protein